jgi:Protein of unknown function (DUF3485)
MKTLIPAGLAILLVVLCGMVHGSLTGRWEPPASPLPLAERLGTVSMELGDWQGQALDFDGHPAGGITGQLYRRYVNKHTGGQVTVFLVCGQAGPVSVHTPDACYTAAGYRVQTPTKITVKLDESASAQFMTAQMTKTTNADQQHLRIFWGWSARGSWQAPDDPRVAFARNPGLYKLYLIHEATRPGERAEDDPCVELMRQLLPELKRSLFTGS